MIDLSRLMQDAIASFKSAEEANFPQIAGNLYHCGNEQVIEYKHISRISRVSQVKSEHIEKQGKSEGKAVCDVGADARASSVSSEGAGNAGNAGNARKINAIPFPQTFENVGNAGKASAGRSINDPALYPRQTDPGRCFVCDEPEGREQVFIAVLTPRRGEHHWMHAGCHAEHSRRVEASWYERNCPRVGAQTTSFSDQSNEKASL